MGEQFAFFGKSISKDLLAIVMVTGPPSPAASPAVAAGPQRSMRDIYFAAASLAAEWVTQRWIQTARRKRADCLVSPVVRARPDW